MSFHAVLVGLKIFEKYGDCHISAEHDEIFAWCGAKINAKDKKVLKNLDWMFDATYDRWKHFV